MIQKLQSLKFEKMGQILCVKKVPFRKSGHIFCLLYIYIYIYIYIYTGKNFSSSARRMDSQLRVYYTNIAAQNFKYNIVL